GVTSTGLPSTSANELFISGCTARALTSAQPIRWVKLTLPPRPRARWLLITMRLSASSLAGTARTLVAVGTARDASMFWTIFAATPRIGVVEGLAGAAAGAAATGAGAAAGVAGAGVGGAVAAGAGAALAAGAGWVSIEGL